LAENEPLHEGQWDSFSLQACTSGNDGFKLRLVSLGRRLLIAALASVLWLIAPSAFASAPRCDIRAATILAPPPTLDTPVSSIDIGDDTCMPPAPLDALQEGRTSSELSFSNAPDLTLTSTATIPPSPQAGELPRDFDSSSAPSGVRSSVDRPPRR
jgi:hypothetical protein